MKCEKCEYDSNCNLKNIAPDITGCTGHSKVRAIKSNEVRCWFCNDYIENKEAIKDKEYKSIYYCKDCYRRNLY